MKHRMVDQILSWERDRRIRGMKAVSFEEYSAKAALGDVEHLPESLMLESLLQLGNWLLVLSTDFAQIGMVSEIGHVRFERQLKPGERLMLEVQVEASDDDSVSFRGEGFVGQTPAIVVRNWQVRRCALEQYHHAQDLRVLYDEICRVQRGGAA